MIEVVYQNGGWAVLEFGLKKGRSHPTKAEAKKRARELAKRRGHKLRVERKDGTHQRSTNYGFTAGR